MIKFPTASGIATMTTKRETLQECRRMKEAQGPALGGRTVRPQMQAPEPERTTIMDTHRNEEGKEKDELLEKSLENKPPEKVVVHGDHPDQTITIGGNLTAECRSGMTKILRKHADAFAWTPADMIRISCFVAKHELKTYPHIEPRVQRKWSIAPDRRKIVKDEKSDDSWRMCIDFKDMNKVCPKDLYLLPEINWKIESLMGFKYKCFLDAYKGYHQIQMAKKDEENTTLHTDEGVFCYTKMPFGLKKCRSNVSKVGRYYLRRANGKKSGSPRRRHGHQKQNRAGNDKRRRRDIIDAQKGKHEVKSQKCSFRMEEEVEEAFPAMKKLIAELPTLTTIKKEEELMVYLLTANEAVSAVVLVERNGRQTSIHYVSRTLQDAEINYPPMEKLALALVHAVRRLRRYFQGHIIKVITDKPISQILNNRETTRRLAKWGVELEACGIKYAPRSPIKVQVLADFLADTTTDDSPAQAKTDGQDNTLTEGENPEEAGLILIDLDRAEYSYALRLKFANSNNDVEYEARFGVPATIITDNGTQLINDSFKSWAEGLGIKLVSTSVYHPQANGTVERANQSIMQGIKTRLNQEGGAWVEELPNILWTHRTTPKTSNRETPFSLTYGTEAVIPVEIGIPTRRTIQGSDKENMEALRLNLNLLEEGRKTAAIREAR
ncbi:reverse transcriptase domain-containing protein [Tanacetum coccineum]